MGWNLLRCVEKGGRADETRRKEVDEIFELDSADDFNALLLSRKKKGGTVVEIRNGIAYYFTIDSIELRRRPPMPSGKMQVVATLAMSLLKRSETIVAPWELAPYNFRASSAQLETSATKFYPGVGDLLWENGTYVAKPLVNTAGVAIPGKSTIPLAKFSFSHNVPIDSFDSRLIWAPLGKINLYKTTVCGMVFPPRTLRLESLAATLCSESVETTDPNGNSISYRWRFYRVDVALLTNSRTFDQLYDNAGTQVRVNGALCRIWTWTNPRTGDRTCGTYDQYLASGARDGERANSPLPLMPNGQSVAPVWTRRVGSPFEPVDFAELGLPSEPPVQWVDDAS